LSPKQDELQQKIQIIRECLEEQFHDVRPHNITHERFFFHDGGKRSFQFGFHRSTMEAFPLSQLRRFMKIAVIPMILENPGMQAFYGPNGLTVREKVPN
jgi:hypothetical protein